MSSIDPLRWLRKPVLLPIQALLLLLFGCANNPSHGRQNSINAIEHIIVIYAENRSFDHLYGLFPGANGIAQAAPEHAIQIDHDGQPFATLPPIWASQDGQFPAILATLPNQPFRIDQPPISIPLSQPTRDLVHRFYQNKEQINGGKNNRYAALSDAGGLVMGHYDGSKLPMWHWAKAYVLADHFFMAAYGGSFLNHHWLVCACTPRFADAPAALRATLDERGLLKRKPESPASARQGPPQFFDGAVTPDGYAVNTVQPPYQPSGLPPAAGGDRRFADPNRQPLPPQTAKTIGDTLSDKGISWAWYADGWDAASQDGTQPAEHKRSIIYHHGNGAMNFQAHHQPFNYYARFAPGSTERARHLQDAAAFFQGIRDGRLPQVVFYKPAGRLNQHPGYAEVLSGDQHTADVIERIKQSPMWPKTAIIVTYDENGGFWDHVSPPNGDRWGPATRVPAIIISPFAKRGFVDHTPYDTTAILQFITRRFGLEPLPGVRKNTGDLSNAFAFDN